MPRSATGAALAAIAALAMTLLLAGGVSARSPAPPSAPPTCDPLGAACPTPTPDSGIEWPPMQFGGGDPGQLMVFTSTCGVWGQDPITLHGEGEAGTAELVVTFDQYDAEAAQWFGRVTGTHTGTNGVTVPVDDAALIYYDFDLGRWVLVASVAAQIQASACAAPSPSG
jgi:hypothetical protein